MFMHGAGNHKGYRRQINSNGDLDNEYFELMNGTHADEANDTVIRLADGTFNNNPYGEIYGINVEGTGNGSGNFDPDSYETNNGPSLISTTDYILNNTDDSRDIAWQPFGMAVMVERNGSSCHYRFAKGRYPKCYNSFYGNMIKGGISNSHGAIGSQCGGQGEFWFANTAVRGNDKFTIQNETGLFVCGGSNCYFGTGDKAEVLYTHSFGGLVTMHAVTSGMINKGQKAFIAMSQPPLNGSPIVNLQTMMCVTSTDIESQGWFWDIAEAAIIPFSNGISESDVLDFITVAFKGVVRSAGYCKGNRTSPNDTWFPGQTYNFNRRPINFNDWWEQEGNTGWDNNQPYVRLYEHTELYATDFTVNYRYCGTDPFGYHMEAITDFGDLISGPLDEILDAVVNSNNLLSTISNVVFAANEMIDNLNSGTADSQGNAGQFLQWINNQGLIANLIAPLTTIQKILIILGVGIDAALSAGEAIEGVVEMFSHGDVKNAIQLAGLNIASCGFYNICFDQICSVTAQMCTYRGCYYTNQGNVCDSKKIGPYLTNNTWVSQHDGMVPLSSCNGWNSYDSSGVSHMTYEATNHEEGTGFNGNGYHQNRGAINWYINVANEIRTSVEQSEAWAFQSHQHFMGYYGTNLFATMSSNLVN